MRPFFLAVLALVHAAAGRQCVAHRDLRIVRAVDGDTVSIAPLPGLPAPLDSAPLSVRVLGAHGARAAAAAAP